MEIQKSNNYSIDFSSLTEQTQCNEGIHIRGKDGVTGVYSTGDGKVEFVCKEGTCIAYVASAMGYPAYYPVHETKVETPLKADPEILSTFNTFGLGKPDDFYDAIITAGFPPRKGGCGTLGEFSPKPHPWLYAETSRVGFGLDFSDRHSIVGIEDSGAGIASIKLAGFAAIGIVGGNVIESGTLGLCNSYCENFEQIFKILKG